MIVNVETRWDWKESREEINNKLLRESEVLVLGKQEVLVATAGEECGEKRQLKLLLSFSLNWPEIGQETVTVK